MYGLIERGRFLTRGAEAPVTCKICGCRLTPDPDDPEHVWRHFHPFQGRDARGCRVDCVNLPHDRTGSPIRPI